MTLFSNFLLFSKVIEPPQDDLSELSDRVEQIQPTDGTEASLKPAVLYLNQLNSLQGRRSQTSALNGVARRLGYEQKEIQLPDETTRLLLPWQQLDWRTLNAVNITANMIGLKAAPSTRNRTLNALRGVARYAWYLGDINDSTYLRLYAASLHLYDKGSREPMGRALLLDELHALLKACDADSGERRIRDKALFMVAACTGFRRHELANLKLSNFERSVGSMRVTIIAKGNREHHAFVVGHALKAIDAWLIQHANRGEYVFCPIYPNKQHPVTDRPLSGEGMDGILHRRSRQAEIRKVNWHDFRRGVGSLLIDEYGIQDAALHLGHKHLEATQRYDKRGDHVLLKTAQFLSQLYTTQVIESDTSASQDMNSVEDWVI